jgi:hypothetical protein
MDRKPDECTKLAYIDNILYSVGQIISRLKTGSEYKTLSNSQQKIVSKNKKQFNTKVSHGQCQTAMTKFQKAIWTIVL